MINLIKFELRKLKKMKSMYVCLAVSLVLMILNLYISFTFSKDTSSVQMMMKNYASSSMLVLILGIFTAIYTCEDYTSHTMKNIVSRGYTRRQVLMAKYIVVEMVALLFNIVALIGCYLIASRLFQSGISSKYYMTSLWVQVLLVLAYNTLFYVFSIVSTKQSTSISLNIIGPSIISLGFNLIDSVLKSDSFKLSYYHLDHLMSQMSNMTITYSEILPSIGVSITVMIICLGVGLYLTNKKEIS